MITQLQSLCHIDILENVNISVLDVNGECIHQLIRRVIFERLEKLIEHIFLVSEDPSIPIKTLVKEVVTRFGYTMTYRKT
ncbi:hypothetical protein Lal_00030244 [Lupinus albus]|nr:hypothetical protein Lal_00030244 [Lupinus albus]